MKLKNTVWPGEDEGGQKTDRKRWTGKDGQEKTERGR
jgi:hypothetical protein